MSIRIVLCALVLACASHAFAETPDTITFTDGEQLAGKLVSVLAGNVTFHSDVLGNVTVPLAKVKTLNTVHPFAVVEKNQHVTPRTAVEKIPVGSLALENQSLRVTPSQAKERSLPVNQIGSVIDTDAFHREVHGDSDFLYGWTGSVTLGASLVESTNSAQTYTGSVAVVRSIPTIAWLPSASKTTLNLSGTYGLAKSSEIISEGVVYQAPGISKTDILHGDSEYDRYFSPAIFGLVNASADHNFGNGLQLQQAYGSGIGWSPLKAPKNSFDVKAGLQYEQQQFYNGLTSGLGTPSINLVSAFLNESWAPRLLTASSSTNTSLSRLPLISSRRIPLLAVRALSSRCTKNSISPSRRPTIISAIHHRAFSAIVFNSHQVLRTLSNSFSTKNAGYHRFPCGAMSSILAQ